MAVVKTPAALEALRQGGALLSSVLLQTASAIRPGARGEDLDALAEELVHKGGGRPSFKGYRSERHQTPYPASLCVSINEEVVHGLPAGKVLREGDIVGLDLGVEYRGFYTDAALTVAVGVLSSEKEKLLLVCHEALQRALEAASPSAATGDVGHAVETYVKSAGLNVVRTLVGHGVGKAVHEPPEVPNFGSPGAGVKLTPGMVIAVEPMITAGSGRVTLEPDGWTWRTKDGAPAAHFEHTILITATGCEVLTKK